MAPEVNEVDVTKPEKVKRSTSLRNTKQLLFLREARRSSQRRSGKERSKS